MDMETIMGVIDIESLKRLHVLSVQDEAVLDNACRILQQGGLVAFPTETVYGLGANGLKEEAARKIYEAKGRPSDNPLILHIADMNMLVDIVKDIPPKASMLADAFWPGPLTMIFHKADCVPKGTTGGLPTVAVRMPDHPLALLLIRKSGFAVAAPSANRSGRPSPTRAEHVKEDLDGRIDMILDGGSVDIGIESTIVDMTCDLPMILRPGFITKQMIEEVIGEVRIDRAILEKPDRNIVPKAPGMKYRHYAPKAQMCIYEGSPEDMAAAIRDETYNRMVRGQRVGIIAAEETKECYPQGIVKTVGSRQQEISVLQGLYRVLREFDNIGVDYICSESFGQGKHGQAVMNRLIKAAGYHIKSV